MASSPLNPAVNTSSFSSFTTSFSSTSSAPQSNGPGTVTTLQHPASLTGTTLTATDTTSRSTTVERTAATTITAAARPNKTATTVSMETSDSIHSFTMTDMPFADVKLPEKISLQDLHDTQRIKPNEDYDDHKHNLAVPFLFDKLKNFSGPINDSERPQSIKEFILKALRELLMSRAGTFNSLNTLKSLKAYNKMPRSLQDHRMNSILHSLPKGVKPERKQLYVTLMQDLQDKLRDMLIEDRQREFDAVTTQITAFWQDTIKPIIATILKPFTDGQPLLATEEAESKFAELIQAEIYALCMEIHGLHHQEQALRAKRREEYDNARQNVVAHAPALIGDIAAQAANKAAIKAAATTAADIAQATVRNLLYQQKKQLLPVEKQSTAANATAAAAAADGEDHQSTTTLSLAGSHESASVMDDYSIANDMDEDHTVPMSLTQTTNQNRKRHLPQSERQSQDDSVNETAMTASKILNDGSNSGNRFKRIKATATTNSVITPIPTTAAAASRTSSSSSSSRTQMQSNDRHRPMTRYFDVLQGQNEDEDVTEIILPLQEPASESDSNAIVENAPTSSSSSPSGNYSNSRRNGNQRRKQLQPQRTTNPYEQQTGPGAGNGWRRRPGNTVLQQSPQPPVHTGQSILKPPHLRQGIRGTLQKKVISQPGRPHHSAATQQPPMGRHYSTTQPGSAGPQVQNQRLKQQPLSSYRTARNPQNSQISRTRPPASGSPRPRRHIVEDNQSLNLPTQAKNTESDNDSTATNDATQLRQHIAIGKKQTSTTVMSALQPRRRALSWSPTATGATDPRNGRTNSSKRLRVGKAPPRESDDDNSLTQNLSHSTKERKSNSSSAMTMSQSH